MLEDMTYEQEAVNVAEAMLRLLDNKDFNSIFVEGYLKDSLVSLGLNMTNVPADGRVKLSEAIISRGVFKQYIDTIITDGHRAKEALNEAALDREEV